MSSEVPIGTKNLSAGFVEGDYSWMQEQVNSPDDITIARFHRQSPREILSSLQSLGLIRFGEQISFAPPSSQNLFAEDKNIPVGIVSAWSDRDRTRFQEAQEIMKKEDDNVLCVFGELVNPDNTKEGKKVMFIAAGGAKEGLVTARGVYQMRQAMERAQIERVPIVYLNAVTSADPLFASEVGQISRQISDTMAYGLTLTVPKVTVITGEAASAGAHAAWQVADTTLILDRGAYLTVINVEEALQLLHFQPEILTETNRRYCHYLQLQNNQLDDKKLREVTTIVQGVKTIHDVLQELQNKQMKTAESGDNLHAIVKLTEAVFPQEENGHVMLIMPADNTRFLEGMLTRGADMVTIHLDDWQSRAEKDPTLTKNMLLEQMKEAMGKAQKRKTQENAQIYCRLKTSDFDGFWTADDVKKILKDLHSVGLAGIRFTEAASVSELRQLTTIMREVEGEEGLTKGTFKMCLSVETDEAINHINDVVTDGDEDRRVAAVVMGVRDYTKSKKADGVKERDWNHPIVRTAKQRLTEQIKTLQQLQGTNICVLHAIASIPNDFDSVHREVASSKELGADGMLAVSPDQIPHVQATLKGIFQDDGSVSEEKLQHILNAASKHLDDLHGGIHADQLLYEYKKIFYQVFHEYRIRLLQAGGAFPRELQKIGIVDRVIVSAGDGSYGEPIARALWEELDNQLMDGEGIREKRLDKLKHVGSQTVTEVTLIDVGVRQRKAEGRGQRAAQFWVDVLTKGDGFTEEILTDLAPNTSFDVLAKMGRMESQTYQGQVKDAQEKTGTVSGIIAGFTKIADRNVLLIVRDQNFINATAGASTGEIVRRACLDAVGRKKNGHMEDVAICYVDVSAGGRVQEGALALSPSELAVAGLVEARSAGIPVINIGHDFILGSDGIGPYYQADKLVLIGENTELGLAGRRIVERASPLGKEEFPPGFRLAQYHKTVGNIDTLIEHPEALYQYLETTLLSL